MHSRNELKSEIKKMKVERLTKELMDVTLELMKGNTLRRKGVNPYGNASERGTTYDLKNLKYKKQLLVNELDKRGSYGK